MQEVVALLTKNKGYTDSNTESARQQILVKILKDYEEPKLVEVVRETVTKLVITTESPLEVADCILAWSIAHDERISSVFNGVRKIDVSSGPRNAQGLALGCFESSVRSRYIDPARLALLRYLGYTLGGKIWENERCTYIPCVTGRMTNAIKLFMGPLWIDTESEMFKEVSAIFSGAIVLKTPKPDQVLYSANPKTLHDALMNELCANFFLAAFPFQRLEVLREFCKAKGISGASAIVR